MDSQNDEIPETHRRFVMAVLLVTFPFLIISVFINSGIVFFSLLLIDFIIIFAMMWAEGRL